MAKEYVVIQDGIDFWIEKYTGQTGCSSICENFTQAKKVLKTGIKEAIIKLKAELKAVGALRKESIE